MLLIPVGIHTYTYFPRVCVTMSTCACRLNLSSVVMCRLLHVPGFPPQVSSLSSVTYVACICTAQAQVLGRS